MMSLYNNPSNQGLKHLLDINEGPDTKESLYNNPSNQGLKLEIYGKPVRIGKCLYITIHQIKG